MSSILPAPQARSYHHAADLPKTVWRALLQNEPLANIVLPFAKKALDSPRGGHSEQLWIVLYKDTNNIEFVLSCTTGPLGNYPIYIVACKSSTQLAQEESHGRDLADSLVPLVLCLLKEVPPQMVFSVFSIANVARKFAEIFEAHTSQKYGIQAFKDPYYDATLTFCTSETLKKPSEPALLPESEDVVTALRRADMYHLKEIKAMCKAFSETLWPYILDDARAELEARLLITNQQAWVHMAQKAGREPEVACLVATAGESDNVMVVTKVLTVEHWRGHGCAARLLHHLCQDIFRKKEYIVLYVGNSDGDVSARKVYHKVGFQGLDEPQGQQVKDVERWLEIAFKGTTLGHW